MSAAPVIPLINYNYSAFLGITVIGRLFILNCAKVKSEMHSGLTCLAENVCFKRTKSYVVI